MKNARVLIEVNSVGENPKEEDVDNLLLWGFDTLKLTAPFRVAIPHER